MAQLDKEKAAKILEVLTTVKTGTKFALVENSPDLKKQKFSKPSYKEFSEQSKTAASLSYISAQRKVWGSLNSLFAQKGLSKNLLKDPQVAEAIYNELFIEAGSWAKTYGLEAAPAAQKVEEASLQFVEPPVEEPQIKSANPNVIDGAADALPLVQGEEPMSNTDNTPVEATATGAAAEEITPAAEPVAPEVAQDAPTTERPAYDDKFWLWAKEQGLDISKDGYENNSVAPEKVAEIYKKYQASLQSGAEPAAANDDVAGESGQLDLIEGEEPPVDDNEWIKEYNEYLTKYGREHNNAWTRDAGEDGQLCGHFEKGPSFVYDSPNKLNFGYKKDDKPMAEDFMGPLSLAKEKGQKLSWNSNISEASRKAIMEACAKVGLDIVGLNEAEQEKFDKMRGVPQETKEEPSKEEPKKALNPVEAMRDKIRQRKADSGEIRGMLLENATEGADKAKLERRHRMYQLTSKGATTYGDKPEDQELLGLELADVAARIEALQGNADVKDNVTSRLSARKADLEIIRDARANPDKADQEKLAAAQKRESDYYGHQRNLMNNFRGNAKE